MHNCIDHVPIFAGLNREEKMEVSAIACTRNFEKGEMIYGAGDEGGTLFILNGGRVKLFRLSATGKEQVVRLVEPGEFIGELSLFSSLPLTDYAQALMATTICLLHGGQLKGLMAKYPLIAFKILDVLARRLAQAENRIEKISLGSVTKRVTLALAEMSQGKVEILLPMTKGDFASQLGMTRETLSRKLSDLQEAGVILLKGQRKIIIKDRSALEGLTLGE